MAEAIVIGLIPALIGTVVTVATQIDKLRCARQDIPKVIKHFNQQLPALSGVLRDILRRHEEGLLSADQQKQLLEPVRACQNEITTLDDLLKKSRASSENAGFRKTVKLVLVWSFRHEKQLKDIKDRLETLKSTLSVISIGNQIETRYVAEDIRRLQYHQLLQPRAAVSDYQKLEGTCNWVNDQTNFMHWAKFASTMKISDSMTDRLLCIYGVHGCGKSVLALSIFHSFQARKQNALFFSFLGSDSTRQNLDQMLKTLLWQLTELLPTEERYRDLDHLTRIDGISIRGLSETMVKSGNRITEPIYCILDGIDECTGDWNDSAQGGLGIVSELLTAIPNLRVLLLGRPASLHAARQKTVLQLEMTPRLVQSDITQLVKAEVESLSDLKNEELRRLISKTMEEKSDGMFLWVKMMFSELRHAANEDEIEKTLLELPRGLDNAYRCVFARLTKKFGPLKLSRARSLLHLVIGTCRPLTVDELLYAYAIQVQPGPGFEKYLIKPSEKGILDVCGDFLSISGALVRLGHTSIKEFLIRHEDDFQPDDSAVAYFRDGLKDIDLSMGSICLDYITMSQYESPLDDEKTFSTLGARYPLLYYASRHVISHLLKAGSPHQSTVYKIQDLFSSSNSVNWLEYLILLSVQDFLDYTTLKCELFTFGELFDEAVGETGSFIKLILDCVRRELVRRQKKYGNKDPRTRNWRNFLESNEDFDQNRAVIGQSGDREEELSHMLTVLRAKPTLTIQSQAEILLSLAAFAHKVKVITDPLKIVFNTIVATAERMPVYTVLMLGQWYQRLRKYDEALKVLSMGLDKVEDQDSIMECDILNEIAHTLFNLHRYDEGALMYRRVIEKRTKLQGCEHRTTLNAYHDLQDALSWLNEDEEIERISLHLIEKETRKSGESHRRTLNAIRSLGDALHNQGKFEAAEKQYRRELRSWEQTKGMFDPATEECLWSLADTIDAQEKYEESAIIWARIAHSREKLSGREHEWTLVALHNQGLALYDQKMYEEAEKFFRLVLETEEKVFGDNHRDSLPTIELLGLSLYHQQKFEEGEILFRRLVLAQEKILGKEHRDISKYLEYLEYQGLGLAQLGRFSEAEKVLHDLAERQAPLFGHEAYQTLETVSLIGFIQMLQRRYQDAEKSYRKALGNPPSLQDVENATFLAELGDVLRYEGSHSEAAQAYQFAGEIFARRCKTDSDEEDDSERQGNSDANNPAERQEGVNSFLSNLYFGQRSLEEANPAQAEEELRRVQDPDIHGPWLAITYRLCLADALDRQGKVQEANDLYNWVLEYKESKLDGGSLYFETGRFSLSNISIFHHLAKTGCYFCP